MALRVTRDESPPSYFVVFITYLAQVGCEYTPKGVLIINDSGLAVWTAIPARVHVPIAQHQSGGY